MDTIWTEERKALALESCRKWAGTPHRDRLAIPGKAGGVDCIHFVAAVLMECGVVPSLTLPGYDERLGMRRSHNVIEDILLRYLHAEKAASPGFGDVVIFRVGKQCNHVGLVVGDDIWHSYAGIGCSKQPIAAWTAQVQSFVRITAIGLKEDPALLRADELRIAPIAPVE